MIYGMLASVLQHLIIHYCLNRFDSGVAQSFQVQIKSRVYTQKSNTHIHSIELGRPPTLNMYYLSAWLFASVI